MDCFGWQALKRRAAFFYSASPDGLPQLASAQAPRGFLNLGFAGWIALAGRRSSAARLSSTRLRRMDCVSWQALKRRAAFLILGSPDQTAVRLFLTWAARG